MTTENPFTPGQTVRLRYQWCGSREEHDFTFRVVEANGDRTLIQLVSEYRILPVELVRTYMIEDAT